MAAKQIAFLKKLVFKPNFIKIHHPTVDPESFREWAMLKPTVSNVGPCQRP